MLRATIHTCLIFCLARGDEPSGADGAAEYNVNLLQMSFSHSQLASNGTTGTTATEAKGLMDGNNKSETFFWQQPKKAVTSGTPDQASFVEASDAEDPIEDCSNAAHNDYPERDFTGWHQSSTYPCSCGSLVKTICKRETASRMGQKCVFANHDNGNGWTEGECHDLNWAAYVDFDNCDKNNDGKLDATEFEEFINNEIQTQIYDKGLEFPFTFPPPMFEGWSWAEIFAYIIKHCDSDKKEYVNGIPIHVPKDGLLDKREFETMIMWFAVSLGTFAT